MEKKILNKEETKEKALRLLEFRSHSEKELRDKLIRAGAKKEDIDSTVEFLLKYGFLNDEKYAVSKAHDLAHLKKFGRMRIKSELKMRGIADEYIEEALKETDFDEKETLMPLVKKKLKDDFERKSVERTIRYFAAKGYGYEDIKDCIERLKSEKGTIE